MIQDFYHRRNSLSFSRGRTVSTSVGERRWSNILASLASDERLFRNKVWGMSYENIMTVHSKVWSGTSYNDEFVFYPRAQRQSVSQAFGRTSIVVDVADLSQLADHSGTKQDFVVRNVVGQVDTSTKTHDPGARWSTWTIAAQRTKTNVLPVMVLERAKALLGEHNVQEATRVLESGASQFPDDLRIYNLLHVISPNGNVRKVNAVVKSRQEEVSWIKIHGRKYRGRWVALTGRNLIAASPTLKELLQQTKHIGRGSETPLIQYIEAGRD